MSNLKVYLNKPNEDWIVDRLVDEWTKHNEDITTENINEANIIWIISPWTYKEIPKKYLKEKKVVCTIHHLDFEKFNLIEKFKYKNLNNYVDYYHAISAQTEKSLIKISNKPIWTNPWWINQNLWYEIIKKKELRKKLNINENSFILGSFQRDTEGKDLKSPKLSKGPDRFIDIVLEYKKNNKNLEVILSGKRRQFIIEKLKQNNIKFHYFEMANLELLNELYNCLDLYIVSSRVEGGPQAIYECALTKTPIISTDVGVASKFLDKKSIFNMENFKEAKPNTEHAYSSIQKYTLPDGFNPFRIKFEELIES
tara:strand:- start:3907 stop:4839 length:933 start_codon:yes stop_codon:yes gene_type:complete